MDQAKQSTINSSPEAVAKFFDRKIDKIYPSDDEFRKKLLTGRKMRFYMGADTTAPRLHIGHLSGQGLDKGAEFIQLSFEVGHRERFRF